MDNGYFEHKETNKIMEVMQNKKILYLACQLPSSSTFHAVEKTF